jgi:hypothetical protein
MHAELRRRSVPLPATSRVAPRLAETSATPRHALRPAPYPYPHPPATPRGAGANSNGGGVLGGHALAVETPAMKGHSMHNLLDDASADGLQRLRDLLGRVGHGEPLVGNCAAPPRHVNPRPIRNTAKCKERTSRRRRRGVSAHHHSQNLRTLGGLGHGGSLRRGIVATRPLPCRPRRRGSCAHGVTPRLGGAHEEQASMTMPS